MHATLPPTAEATCSERLVGPGLPAARRDARGRRRGRPGVPTRPDVRLDTRPGGARPPRDAGRASRTGSRCARVGSGPSRTRWRARSDVAGVRDLLALAAGTRRATASRTAAGPASSAASRPGPGRRPGHHGRARGDARADAGSMTGQRAGDLRRAARPDRRWRRPWPTTDSTSGTSRSRGSTRRSAAGWRPGRPASNRSAMGGSRTCSPAATSRRPRDRWTCPTHPASAAGPDLRQLVLGSEGRAGIITDVVVRARPTPRRRRRPRTCSVAGRARSASPGRSRVGRPADMVRVSTPLETATTFALGRRRARGAASFAATSALRGRGWRALPGDRRGPGSRRVVRAAARDIGATSPRRIRRSAPRRRRGLGTGAVPRRRTCATRCGTPATRWTPSRPRSTGAAWSRSRRPSDRRCGTAWSRAGSASTRSATSRTSTAAGRACTRPTSSGWRPTRTRRSSAGAGSRPPRARSSSPTAGRSATSTASARDHVPYLEAEKGPLGMAALRGGVRARSTRTGSWPRACSSASGPCIDRRHHRRDRRRDAERPGHRLRPRRRGARRGAGPDRAVRLAAAGVRRAGPRALLALGRRGDCRRLLADPARPPRRDRRGRR